VSVVLAYLHASEKVNLVFRVERQRTINASERARRSEEKPQEQPLQDRVVLVEQQQSKTRERPEKSGRPLARNARLSVVVGLVR